MSLDHPAVYNDQVGQVVGLINDLYQLAPTGGPLHVVVDDWNVEDGDLTVHQTYRADGSAWYPPEVIALAEQVAGLMRGMSTAERLSTLAHQEGILERGQPTAVGESCLECHLAELADDPTTACACRPS